MQFSSRSSKITYLLIGTLLVAFLVPFVTARAAEWLCGSTGGSTYLRSVSSAASALCNISLPIDLITPPINDSYYLTYLGGNLGSISNPNVSIQYHARVRRTDTREVLQPGASVPKDTPLSFEFVPHDYRDIYWFAMGYGYDSPYGEWRSGALPPAISCESKDFVGRFYTDYAGIEGGHADIYSALVANPPTKDVGNADAFSCDTPRNDGSVTCRASSVGTFTPAFNFGATYAKFYGRLYVSILEGDQRVLYGCFGSNDPMYPWDTDADHPYTLQVPAQSIPFPITVITANAAPQPPQASAGGCIVGSPTFITVVGSDPDGDQIRYGVDWNADGVIDQYAPPTGYVPSGTSESASRTYSTVGTKTVMVRADDSTGLSSGWTISTFECSCPTGQTLVNGACIVSCTPSSFSCADSTHVVDNCGNSIKCATGQSCSGGMCGAVQCFPKYFCSGSDLYYQNAECVNTLTQSCSWGCSAGQCLPMPTPTLDFTVNPLLIQKGYSVAVSWTTTLVYSCAVTGTNGDSWTGISGTQNSSPIMGQTIFNARCVGTDNSILQKSATVNTIPIFCEPGGAGC